MKQEDKQLILVDLCARVPYHPKGRVVNNQTRAMCEEWLTCATFQMFVNVTNNCRLYLRPMSSMTEEEEKEFYYNRTFHDRKMFESEGADVDWLNAHHFDYRSLIKKVLH